MVAAVLLLALLPLWPPLAAAADLARGRRRLPTARLLAFGLCWAWLETVGVTVAFAMWLVGRRRNTRAHFALQRWWAARLMGSLQVTTGIRIEATEAACLRPGPAIMLCRHASLADDQVAVIFPEGTRSSAKKRARAMEKIRERDPARADRLAGMQHLLPPRPAGSAALLDGCPAADVIIAWHVGFDGLDTFGGILRHLAHRPLPVQFHARRIDRADVPTGEGFAVWLDEMWVQSDRAVHALLQQEGFE